MAKQPPLQTTMDLDDVQHPAPPSPPSDSCNALVDPPPPYPSRERRTRTARPNRRPIQRIQTTLQHQQRNAQAPSTDSHSDYEARASPQALLTPHPFSAYDGEFEPTETTPFLGPLSSSPRGGPRRLLGRPRSLSHMSTISAAPSLAHTVFSLFQTEDDDDADFSGSLEERALLSPRDYTNDNHHVGEPVSRAHGIFSLRMWQRYFRPLVRKAYYKSLFHLLVLNFPFALVAWVYLFVFTLVCIFPYSLSRTGVFLV